MRALAILGLLLVVPASAAERTWTIARDVYTTAGELIAVRGEFAYLKIDGKVKEIPIDRLSALDQSYLATVSLAPIAPQPAGDALAPHEPTLAAASSIAAEPAIAVEPVPADEDMPLPVQAASHVAALSPAGEPPQAEQIELNAPDLAPAFGGTPEDTPMHSLLVPHTVRRVLGLPQPDAANFPRAHENEARDGDAHDGGSPGIFGFRARWLERERAAAARSR